MYTLVTASGTFVDYHEFFNNMIVTYLTLRYVFFMWDY